MQTCIMPRGVLSDDRQQPYTDTNGSYFLQDSIDAVECTKHFSGILYFYPEMTIQI